MLEETAAIAFGPPGRIVGIFNDSLHDSRPESAHGSMCIQVNLQYHQYPGKVIHLVLSVPVGSKFRESFTTPCQAPISYDLLFSKKGSQCGKADQPAGEIGCGSGVGRYGFVFLHRQRHIIVEIMDKR